MIEEENSDMTEETPAGDVRSAGSGGAPSARTLEERLQERARRRAANAAERRRWRAKSRDKRRAGATREGTPPAVRSATGHPRARQGIVVSDNADKTITVQIDEARQHRTYGKIVRTTTKLSAHDERNEASSGDVVRVVETRPISRTKRWRLDEILERAR